MFFRLIKSSCFILLAISLIGTSVRASSRLTLKDCFDLALKQSELLKIDQESVVQSKTRYNQARARIRPNLSWKYAYLTQDTSAGNSNSGFDPSITRRHLTNSRFNATQPLYSGLKEFAAMSSLLKQEKADELFVKRAMSTLYGEVADAFYNVLVAEADLRNIRDNLDLSNNRISELHNRVRLGKSRSSEILSDESQAEKLKSDEAKALGDILKSRAVLSFLTGHDVGDADLLDEVTSPPTVIALSDALKKAESRDDIQAFKEEADAKRKAIQVARSAYQPTAGLEGNYYTQRSSTFLKEIDWDITLNVTVPIYQGGQVAGESDEAKSLYRQAQLQSDRLNRQVRLDVTTIHTSLQTSLQQVERLHHAHDKAKENYDALVSDYRLGLVNNLEVLAVQNSMQLLKHDLDNAVYDSKFNFLNLNVAIGEAL